MERIKVSTHTEEVVAFDELGEFTNDTLIHRPRGDSESVVMHTLRTIAVDTRLGNIIDFGHAVCDFINVKILGGGIVAQIFARETRYTIKEGTTAGTIYGNTHVPESDADTDGTATNLVIDHLPDTSATATWFQNLLTEYLDPRHLHITRGGRLGCVSQIGSATHTASNRESGGIHTVQSGSGCVVTIPADSREGFDAVYVHGDSDPAHTVSITVPVPGAIVCSGTPVTSATGEALRVRFIAPGTFLVTKEKA